MVQWCGQCRRSFQEFEGIEGQPHPGEPTPETLDAWKRLYARFVETSLAYRVLVEIERGELPAPPSFTDLFERRLPDLSPSRN